MSIKKLLEEGKDPMEGKILRVFDWKRERVREAELDVPCKHIGISHDDKTLWAVALTPEIALIQVKNRYYFFCI
jgi:hypothetical protein